MLYCVPMRRHQGSSITSRLTRSFISSTLIPFLCIVTCSAYFSNRSYQTDILKVTDSYLESMAITINQYVKDMEQVALLPFFNDDLLAQIKELSAKETVSNTEADALGARLDTLLSAIRYSRGDFYAGLIVSGRNVLYHSSNYTWAKPKAVYDWESEPWYREAWNDPQDFHFLPPHIPGYYDPSGGRSSLYYDRSGAKEVLSIVGTIRDLKTNTPYAVIKIDFLPSAFDAYLADEDFHVPSSVFLTDADDNVLYQTKAGGREGRMNVADAEGKARIDERAFYHLAKPVEKTDYTIHVILDRKAIEWKSQRIYLLGFFFYGIAFLIALSLNKKFSRRVSEPIEEIERVLEAAGKGDFSVRFRPRPKWELLDVGESVNHMIIALDRTIKTTYVAEMKRSEAENRALLSQIQPHFLFNTLDSMIALLYDDDKEGLEKSLYSLSAMLRYVLDTKPLTTVGEELAFLESYLTLQKYRFPDRLAYRIDQGPGTARVEIPRLLLQPFVENSIIHGMEPLERRTCIIISTRRTDDGIVLVIKDDGAGFDRAGTDLGASIGISNCTSRLTSLFPGSSITIQSEPGAGCTVTINRAEGGKR